MASQIETALYGEEWASRVTAVGEVGAHSVLSIGLSEKALSIRVAPWELRFSRWTEATFQNVHLDHFAQTAAEPDDLQFPWGIIGFHSQQIESGIWQFNLNCHWTRWQWSADWPAITRGGI